MKTSYQERRLFLTPDAVNSLSFNGHRVMIEAGPRKLSYSDKEYSEAAQK
jgi:alanine dehydrogenase